MDQIVQANKEIAVMTHPDVDLAMNEADALVVRLQVTACPLNHSKTYIGRSRPDVRTA